MQLLDHCLRPLSYPPIRADVVHAVTNGLGVLPALTAKWQYGTPVIVTEHGIYLREQYLHEPKGPYRWPVKALYLEFLRRLCALGYREAETITPGNVYNRRWEERLGAEPERIRTVYNGVDPANFPAITASPRSHDLLGRADRPDQGPGDAAARVRAGAQEMPEARLRMFGSPPKGRESYLERCKALAAELGHRRGGDVRGPCRQGPRRLRRRQHRRALQRLRGLPLQPDRGHDLRPDLRGHRCRRGHRGGRRYRPGRAARATRRRWRRPA